MDLAQRLRNLFAGYEDAFGIFEINDTRERDGKQVGKVALVKRPVTEEVWRQHLTGAQALGIIPIRGDNTCLFGAIDIDAYGSFDHSALAKKVDKSRFPLALTRSKSGGAHLWIFFTDPVPAALVQTKLREFASAIGFGRSEIFPKQSEILVDRGDLGNWINMPYYNGAEGGRYGIDAEGRILSVEEFVAIAELKKISAKQLKEFKIKVKDDLSDGPPCLQHLITQGFPDGTRNNGLFALGVYARKAFPDSWEAKLEEYNGLYMDPPLAHSEVKEIAKSLKKKDYQYTCSNPPICHHCNASVCRGRKFGVGEHSGMPTIGGLTKFASNPPIWFVDVEGGGRLELATEDLQSQGRFQKVCMETLNMMPPFMGVKAWQALIQSLMENVTIIQPPNDASPVAQFDHYVNEYLTARPSQKKDDLLRGKVIYDGSNWMFRMVDLLDYLQRHRFITFKQNQIAMMLQDRWKAKHKFINIKGKGVNVYVINAAERQSEPFDIPESIREPY